MSSRASSIPGSRKRRRSRPRRTLAQRAKATLARVRFASGERIGGMELSPRMTRAQQRALTFWIRRLPDGFVARLPRLKLAVAERLGSAQAHVFINEAPQDGNRLLGNHLHAVSYISQRYVVFQRDLFRQRVELGRILYHELCHFLWPRLGNPRRRSYQAALREEFRHGTRGELGYSSQWRKDELRANGDVSRRGAGRRALWRDYVCESFCDTGSFVLLGSERRAKHSEYTLSLAARQRRHRWVELIWGVETSSNGKRNGAESAPPTAS